MYDFFKVSSHMPLDPLPCHTFSNPIPLFERDVLYGRPLASFARILYTLNVSLEKVPVRHD